MKSFLFFLSLLFVFSSYAHKKDTSQVEWIKVYFNSKSDYSVAFEGNRANDEQDMMAPLIERINAAKYSIDLAAYDFQNIDVAHALANASRRGIRVRVVTDNSTRNHSLSIWDTLRNVGIYSIDDAGTVYHPEGKIAKLTENLPNAGAIMHHKFAVFDIISEDPEDYYVWTGSMNITYTGPWNTNTTILIKDSGIAKEYAYEFYQMWGSNSEEPNPYKARFHKDKYRSKNNIHYIDSIRVEVYFGPMDRGNTKKSIAKRITELIEDYAKHDVNFLAFAISPNINISQAMIERSGRGEIQLKGVIDPMFYTQYRNQGAIWTLPEMSFGNRHILSGKEVRKLHEKVIIIDALYPHDDGHKAVAIAGSYNFSIAAEQSNDENILMIFDNHIANQYYQDFMGVYSRAKGLTTHRYPEIDTSKWYDNFRIGRSGEIEVELAKSFYYPVQLLGVDIPRTYAGHKDSCYYYSEEANSYLKDLVLGKQIKISAGKEIPEHKFGRYYGYIQAKDDTSIIHLNREMLATGNASYSFWNRQQEDSILTFKYLENIAKKSKIGMWEHPELVQTKQLTNAAEKIKHLFPLELNYATEEDLMFIPGVGPKTAQNIIDYRNENGYYNNLDELIGIKGIGEKTLEKLKQYLYIDN